MAPSLMTPGPQPEPEHEQERLKSAGASDGDGIDTPASPPSPATTTAAAAATPASAADNIDSGGIDATPAPARNSADSAAVVYCLCRGPDDGSMMVECGGCVKWFHTRCVGLPLRSAGPRPAIEAEAEAAANTTASVPTAVELIFSIPDDWRCPRCARGGVHRGRKRQAEGGGGAEAEEEDSEAEEAAVEGEVEALLAEQGVEGGVDEDEELAACFRREVRRRRALGAYVDWRLG